MPYNILSVTHILHVIDYI